MKTIIFILLLIPIFGSCQLTDRTRNNTIAIEGDLSSGNQEYTENLATIFTPTQSIRVTHIGVFDSGGNGFTGTISVGFFQQSDGAQVGSTMTFTSSSPGDLKDDNFRTKPIAPIILQANTQYALSAIGFSADDKNGNSAISGSGTTLTANNAITWDKAGYGGAVLGYPDTDYSTTNVFHAGTFLFTY